MIIFPFGLFEFKYMPFGLKNVAPTFQHLMDTIFHSCPFVYIYLDDILIFSHNRQEHFQHLKHVLTVLADNSLRINTDKCTFAVHKVDCLGHHLTPSGLSPLPSRVQPILSFPRPADGKVLQWFLGILSFYRRFLPGLFRIIQSLIDACKGTGPIAWNAQDPLPGMMV